MENGYREEKLVVIRTCLHSQFQYHEIAERYDSSRMCWTYILMKDNKNIRISISEEFVDDHSVKEIKKFIERNKLFTFFQQVDVKWICIQNDGISLLNPQNGSVLNEF